MAVEELKASGWDVLVVWECQTGDLKSLEDTLQGFLDLETKSPYLGGTESDR